jgi:hypothetical protein
MPVGQWNQQEAGSAQDWLRHPATITHQCCRRD